VFDRYNIVSEADLKEAARKMEQVPQEPENEHTLSILAPETVQIEKPAKVG
jgi:hypothetical protein